ncbi:MAG: outer membrane lipid asymmetry maintenance protein MlaD [Alphaproteobacteria bacterium]
MIETVIGALVLAIAVLFGVFAYTSADVRDIDGYRVTARFDRVDGIQVGSDVRIGGIKIGTVSNMALDPEFYQAVTELIIDPSVRLPSDTVAKVTSDGLLGSKYMALDPGGAEDMIQPGGEIRFTQSSLSLEDLVGQFIFSNSADDKEGDSVPE